MEEVTGSGSPKRLLFYGLLRENLPEKDRVLKTVEGILNKLTKEKLEVLRDQFRNLGINSADILLGVVSLIFEKAVLEPTCSSIIADFILYLRPALPEFPSNELNGKSVTFMRILVNICQETFEDANNLRAKIKQMTAPDQELERCEKERMLRLRTLGNVKFIGELYNKKIIPEKIIHHCIQKLLEKDREAFLAEENVESLCQLLNTVGKQLDENLKSRVIIDSYFVQLEEMSNNPHLSSRMRFMVRDILDLRAQRWIPRHQDAAPVLALSKVAIPYTLRKNLSEKYGVLKTVEGILNELSPEKLEVLRDQFRNLEINSAGILEGIVSLIFEKAVLEPTSCPIIADLILYLIPVLPQFPSNEPDENPITFWQTLLNICQETFEGADNLQAEIKQTTALGQALERRQKERMAKRRTMGTIWLIGELYNKRILPEIIIHRCIWELLGEDGEALPAEENVEVLCQLFNIVGKQLDENPRTRVITNSYFVRLQGMSNNSHLARGTRIMIANVVRLRCNGWEDVCLLREFE